MNIQRVDAWRIGDKTFFSAKDAQDYVDGLLFRQIKSLLIGGHFTESDCYKIATALLTDKAAIAGLLSTTVEAEA